jgi:glycine hydroxymethyltransferase
MAGRVAAWLRALSDGYAAFDEDLQRKLPGVVWVKEIDRAGKFTPSGEAVDGRKPYYVGIDGSVAGVDYEPLPEFTWIERESPIRRTPLADLHRQLGAKMIPFAGWEMPVWYTSVVEEHMAVRQAAGLFDVAHMGVYQAEGPDAASFLDSVVGNDIGGLAVGNHLHPLPDLHANVIDDLLVYRRGDEKFLVVVNASNDDKDWAWLNAVKEGLCKSTIMSRLCLRAKCHAAQFAIQAGAIC